MNNYIIDPSVFYWVNVFGCLQVVFAVIGAFVMTGCICLAVAYVMQRFNLEEPEEPEQDANRYDIQRYQRHLKSYEDDLNHVAMIRKWMIVSAVIGGVLIVSSIFIPSKQTSVEMLVARTATFDNVNWTVQQVKEVIDYIIGALKGV